MHEKISKIRKVLGLTQKQLADLAGVSQSLIAKIESGKIDPAYSKVMQIMTVLEGAQKKEKRTVESIMTPKIYSVSRRDTLDKAIKLMQGKDISQLPVFDDKKCVGSLSEGMIVDLISEKGANLKSLLVQDAMGESLPMIPAKSFVDVAFDLLRHYPAVLLEKNGETVGIVTKADLLKAV